jgi:hypothetical protein
MLPLYFPFTFADQAAAARLSGWFNRMGLLAPSVGMPTDWLAPGVDPAFWQIHSPPPGDEDALAHLEADLRQWARVHAGADLAAVLASRDEQSPFSTLPAVSRLRSRIQAGVKGQATSSEPDPLMTARIFLRLAHGLDRDHAAIRDQLRVLAGNENQMLRQLHGQPDDDNPLLPPEDDRQDPGSFLTERRLTAWSRLALAAEVQTGVFVTDSPAVIAALGEYFSPFRSVWSIAPEAADGPDCPGPGQLAALIARVLNGGAETEPCQAGDPLPQRPAAAVFSVDLAPESFCRRLAAGRGVPGILAPTPGRTLVVWIDPLSPVRGASVD